MSSLPWTSFGLVPRLVGRRAAEFLHARGVVHIYNRNRVEETWIDVGAHLGETTFHIAAQNPRLLVFAFEPNWELARQIMGRLANFVVLPMAVSEADGLDTFFVNRQNDSSSFLRIREEVIERAKAQNRDCSVKAEIKVPTIRLDTFMGQMDLRRVDYLKVDAEGTDLRVIRSAGDRLKDICRVKAEVDVVPGRYGETSRAEMLAFMGAHGFKLTAVETQNEGRQENLSFAADSMAHK